MWSWRLDVLGQEVIAVPSECGRRKRHRLYRYDHLRSDSQRKPLASGLPGGAVHTKDKGVDAAKHQLMVGGHPVYGAHFDPGMGYACRQTTGIATGNEPESMYMLVAGRHYNDQCCFDYGTGLVQLAKPHIANTIRIHGRKQGSFLKELTKDGSRDAANL